MITNYLKRQSNEKNLEEIIDIVKDKNPKIGHLNTNVIKADFKKRYQNDPTKFQEHIQDIFQYDLNDDTERKEAVNIIFNATKQAVEPSYQQAA